MSQAPIRIFFMEIVRFLCCFLLLYIFQKKLLLGMEVGGCGLVNPSFSRIFLFFFNLLAFYVTHIIIYPYYITLVLKGLY